VKTARRAKGSKHNFGIVKNNCSRQKPRAREADTSVSRETTKLNVSRSPGDDDDMSDDQKRRRPRAFTCTIVRYYINIIIIIIIIIITNNSPEANRRYTLLSPSFSATENRSGRRSKSFADIFVAGLTGRLRYTHHSRSYIFTNGITTVAIFGNGFADDPLIMFILAKP